MKAKRSAEPPKPPLLLAVPREQAAKQISERIEKGELLRQTQVLSYDELQRSKDAYGTWSSYNTEMLRRLFTSPELAEEYSFFGGFAIGVPRDDLARDIRDHHREIEVRIHRLHSIRERLPLIPEAPGAAPATALTASPGAAASASNRVFVVHGHDEGMRESIARFLERFGLESDHPP